MPKLGYIDLPFGQPTEPDPGTTRFAVDNSGNLIASIGGAAFAPVGGGVGVQTNATLTGNGTGGSPLGVNPVAARAPDSLGYWANFFQQRSGLSPLSFVTYFNEFNEYSRAANQNTSAGQGIAPAGTGATAVYNVTAGDGIITTTSQSSGSGNADWSNGGSSGDSMIVNMNTKLWLIAYRFAVAKAPGASSRVIAGLFGGAKIFGIGYMGAQTNFQYVFGTYSATPVNTTATTKAIDSSGTAYVWAYIASLDRVNVVGSPDVVGGVAETNLDVVSNIPANVGAPYFANYGANADVIQLDAVAAFCER